jgi:hypothetical protein
MLTNKRRVSSDKELLLGTQEYGRSQRSMRWTQILMKRRSHTHQAQKRKKRDLLLLLQMDGVERGRSMPHRSSFSPLVLLVLAVSVRRPFPSFVSL